MINYPDMLQPLIDKFLPFAQKRMGFSKPPRLFVRSDSKNACDPLGKTAHYDSDNHSITLYVTKRHPKDVLRSLSHELVHHTQNCRGDLNNISTSPGYAQSDDHMREMEREAYELGNMCFRDWEDGIKNTIYYEHLQKGEIKMSTKDWKNKELRTILSEAWGFKFNTLQEFDEFNGTGEIQEVSIEDPDAPTEETAGEASDKREKANLEEAGEIDRGALKEDSEAEETHHYGEDESADKRKEDDLEHDEDSTKHHLDGIEHHLDALRKDMRYDQDHEWSKNESVEATDGEELEEDAKPVDPLREAIKALLTKHLKG
jgi:hypothetical protein